jgi:hypothetical protein
MMKVPDTRPVTAKPLRVSAIVSAELMMSKIADARKHAVANKPSAWLHVSVPLPFIVVWA